MNFSLLILISLSIEIFALVFIASSRCAPIIKRKRSVFKWFITSNILKCLFHLFIGSIIVFAKNFTCTKALTVIYYQTLYIIDLKLCCELAFLTESDTLKNPAFYTLNHQLFFILVSSLASFINYDQSFIILTATALLSAIFNFVFCNVELSAILVVYVLSYGLFIWLGDTVMFIFQTVLWSIVAIWFHLDLRRTLETYSSTVADDSGFETIDLS